MSSCCSDGASGGAAGHAANRLAPLPCPECRQFGDPLKPVTPRNTLHSPYRSGVEEVVHYYCASLDCNTVYYTASGEHYPKQQLINIALEKSSDEETPPLCYCFKIGSRETLDAMARHEQPNPYREVERYMGERNCFCERSNPSGRCCLNAIARWMQDHNLPLDR